MLFDPLAGRTHQETGVLAVGCHRSQGFGFVPHAGAYCYYYQRIHALAETPALGPHWYSGLDPTLTVLPDYPGECVPGLRGRLGEVVTLAGRATALYQAGESVRAAGLLLNARDLLPVLARALAANPEPAAATLLHALEMKQSRFESAAAACLGVRLEATAAQAHLVPGQRVEVATRVFDGLGGFAIYPISTRRPKNVCPS